ncbi:hypothetical protein M758_12G089600 [Ceratodon purpureus]|nr:hypothetical protein M758_12G089600 [Ceratodon purpureus]
MATSHQQGKTINIWHKELNALGYEDPLPAPIPSVQVVICALKEPRLHQFIQEQDLLALSDVDEDGESAPLLLTTLDLSDWTHLLVLGGSNPETGLSRLREAHSKLIDILEKDDLDLRATEKIIPVLEKVLAHANSDSKSPLLSKVEETSHPDEDHPLLSKITLSSAEQAALEHYKTLLASSSSDIRSLLLRKTGKRCNIPLAPPRSVEHMLMFRGHKAWNLNCMSHLAPITVHMWQTWSRLTNDEVETCRKNALNNKGQIKDAITIPHAFPLSTFEHSKCSSSVVKLLTKQELPTGEFRREKHLQEFWNCGRPYLRCSCNSLNANDGRCDGSVIWWDHAVWMMVNRLELFFGEEYPTLRSKLAAFWIWIASSGKVAVKSHLTFAFRRDLTIEGVLEFANNQTGPLLTKYGDGAGVRQIERLIKPASFSLSNPLGSVGKRQKLNLNAAPGPERGASGGGRGSFNKNYRAKKSASPFEVFEKKPSAEHLKDIDRKANLRKSADGSCSSDIDEPPAPAPAVTHPLLAKVCIWENEEVS